jgi:ketosteroid isomerase-like protein
VRLRARDVSRRAPLHGTIRRRAMRIPCAIVLLGVVACSPQPASSAKPPRSSGVDSAMLVQLEKSFEAATATRGPDGWLSYISDSSASFPPGQLIQLGRDAERRAISGVLADTSNNLQWTPTYQFMAQSGDLAYTYGYYRLWARDAKAKMQEHTGTYVTIWRRQPDSSWKVAVDVGSPGPIPPGFFH